MGKSAVFFGMYNWVDYWRFLWHRGPKTVFWCGSDILNLQKRPRWQKILAQASAHHICENVIEERALSEMGIECSEVKPCLFDSMKGIRKSFKPSKAPHVYLCIQPGREGEYGLWTLMEVFNQVPDVMFHIYGGTDIFKTGYREIRCYWPDFKNVIFHGKVPNEQFNGDIKNFHAALRLNEFDGFSEILAKSVLMGQYPISRIPYPHMDSYETIDELVILLKQLKNKKRPNPATEKWRKILA